MVIIAAAAPGPAAGRKGSLSRCSFFCLLPNLLLLLGFAVLSLCGATTGDEEARPHPSYARQVGSDTIGRSAYKNRSGFIRGNRVVGARAPLTRMPGRNAAASMSMTAHRRLEGMDMTQGATGFPLVKDGSGGENAQAATIRRMKEDRVNITKETLKKLKVVVVLQDEGIIYCPIPKVSSSEWKRALRWMMGDKNWDKRDRTLHNKNKNGLKLLADRGLEDTRWAMESDRFTRFVVVRDPAERLVSGFMNKCARDGYESGRVSQRGAPNCDYLAIMPELFPYTTKASLASHARFKELAEADPEDTFFHFARGIYKQAEIHGGNTCKIGNVHYRPQACFCDLPNLLPAFHVMPLSNLSAEADALAGRLPAALPDSGGGVFDFTGVDGMGGMIASNRKTGVNETRRKEIHAFLGERFTEYHQTAFVMNGTTRAGDKKGDFLSERVMEIIHKMYEKDYDLLGDYF